MNTAPQARAVGNAVFLECGCGARWGTASEQSAKFQAKAITQAMSVAFAAGRRAAVVDETCWTSVPPTVPGEYWIKSRLTGGKRVVFVWFSEGGVTFDVPVAGHWVTRHADWVSKWCGPLVPPEE